MALVSSAADDILAARIYVPRIGDWTADVLFDDVSPRTGRVVLQMGQFQFVGTIDRGGEFEDTDRTRVVGGAGGLGKAASPRQFTAPTLGLVVSSLLSTAGEILSGTADQGVLGRTLPGWTTSAEPIGVVLTALMVAAGGGAVWRVLPDGTVWVGRESWPAAGIAADSYQVMERRFEDGSVMVTLQESAVGALRPGTVFEGQRVSLVIHQIEGEGDLGPYMRVWFSDADEGAMEDRLSAAFERAVRSADPPVVDYRALYMARVVAQSGNQIHVEPELAGTMPDMGAVPLIRGTPGIDVDGLVGGNVLVGWRGGDRSKAYAIGFDPDVQAATMTVGGAASTQVGRGALPGPAVMGTPLIAYLTALAAAVNAIGGSATPPPPNILSTSVTVTS